LPDLKGREGDPPTADMKATKKRVGIVLSLFKRNRKDVLPKRNRHGHPSRE
jgi:hypothetical protein